MGTDVLYSIYGGITIHPLTVSAAISLIVSILLLCFSAIISASEVAFFSLDPKTLNELEESESKADRNILRLLKTPQRLLATMLIGNNFLNVAVIFLLTYFTNTILNFDSAPLLGFIFQTIIITFAILLFAEIIPKVYATQFAQKTAVYTVPYLSAIEKLFGVFVSFLVNSTSFVNNRLAKHNHSNISMDELSHALELTSNNKDEDTEILEGIIKFGNIQVVDIMTSRVDMVIVDIKTNYKKLLEIKIESGYSRIPVYAGTRDNIKGLLYSKDLLPHLDKPANFRWQTLIRPAYYVPETKKIDDLLNEFQTNKVHLAIVVDEYGGTSGLVTLEDILEEIVGDISDEYDNEEVLFTKIDNHTFIFEAKILLNDFFKIAEIEEDDFVKVTEEVETLAGLILELKGDIPTKNERIDYGRYVFEIVAADNRRIKKVKLYIKDDFKNSDMG
ncbi:gliding motility-associated protein GldE [Paludibacter propionicigenes WB4]|uniref:Gliding motility-associated protein GldE n=1 Tax=Paludibacter propionicigenes (strain DSM 17365 / JCM 13257 / WB4) TaxID=694427 RepID=E4T8G0_PALPW|nr:gliding motility-associated protein GldE [Paludibacter propionicigenes]ADQ81004.1 gliding motility-associated protein GldE [Paludibacter propionicigenes WB4]